MQIQIVHFLLRVQYNSLFSCVERSYRCREKKTHLKHISIFSRNVMREHVYEVGQTDKLLWIHSKILVKWQWKWYFKLLIDTTNNFHIIFIWKSLTNCLKKKDWCKISEESDRILVWLPQQPVENRFVERPNNGYSINRHRTNVFATVNQIQWFGKRFIFVCMT